MDQRYSKRRTYFGTLQKGDFSDFKQTFAIVLCGWLGGFGGISGQAQPGRLLSIEEVGQILQGMLLNHSTVYCSKLGSKYSAGESKGKRCVSLDN